MATVRMSQAAFTERNRAKKKKNGITTLVVPKNATLRQIYAAYKKQFTAADLAKYLEDEPMMPTGQLLAEMEQIQREETAKRKRK